MYETIIIFIFLIFSFLFFSKNSRNELFLKVPFFLNFFIGLLSVLYIEKGIYILEQDRFSYHTNAALRLLLYILIFIFFFNILISKKNKSISKKGIRLNFIGKKNNSNIFFLTVANLLIITLLYINLAISSPPPIFSDSFISRHGYIETTKLWFFLQIFGKVAGIVPIISGLCFKYSIDLELKKVKIMNIIFYFMYINYLIILGNKFGGLLWASFYFFTPTLISIKNTKRLSIKINKKIFYILIFISMALLGFYYLITYHYSKYFITEEYGGAAGFIIYRIFGLQGHLWWGIDLLITSNTTYNFSFTEIIDSMPTMMRLITPFNIESAIENGLNFSFGFPANIFLFFGIPIGLLILIILAISINILIREIIKNIVKEKIYSSILLIYIYSWIFNFFSIGSLSTIISLKFTIFIVLYILISKLESRRYNHFRKKAIIKSMTKGHALEELH